MRYMVDVNLDEQSNFYLEKLRHKDVKRVILDPISNLVVNRCYIRSGYLGSSYDLDLDIQWVKHMWVSEGNVEIWIKCDKHNACIKGYLDGANNSMPVISKLCI